MFEVLLLSDPWEWGYLACATESVPSSFDISTLFVGTHGLHDGNDLQQLHDTQLLLLLSYDPEPKRCKTTCIYVNDGWWDLY